MVLIILSACSGGTNPVTVNSGVTQDAPPVIGLQTAGIEIDSGNNSDDWVVSVAPGTSHLVTVYPPSGYEDSEFEISCSSGSWVVDGELVGYYITTDEMMLEWAAPQETCEVQIIAKCPWETDDGIKMGIMINVSSRWYMNPRPPIPYNREMTIAHPLSGQSILAAEGELLVRLRDDAPLTDVLALSPTRDYTILERISQEDPVFRIRFDENEDISAAWQEISNDPRVDVVEPNYLAYPTLVPDDPDYGNKHEFPKIDATLAWDIATGSPEVWVATIDTGADRNHPDLAGNILPGADFILGGDGIGGETPGDGVDNNQDGMVDQNVGHGTHVAGIIAAQAFNGEGACGIAFNTKILPLRIFPTNGDTGATFSSIIEAVQYAANEPNVRVISMSIGTTYESSLLQSAVNQAWAAGKVLVAAAANSNTDDQYYPGAHNNVVAVAAINKSGEKASFSNYGTWVDISAYGTGIYSTYYDDTYAYMSGTSMACPLVSGCAALLFAYDPTLTNELCVDILTTFTDDVYTDNPEYTGQLGSGLVNPYLALEGLSHSQPGDLDDVASDGNQSTTGIEPGPGTQG